MILDDNVIVYPGHGQGTSCGKDLSSETVGKLGDQKLTNYAFEHIVTIDKLIQDKLKNWAMHRLAIMDKVILRMSITEMFYMEGIPPKVSMAEGIEIAKQFSTIDSSGFINGILDAIYNDNKNSISKVV